MRFRKILVLILTTTLSLSPMTALAEPELIGIRGANISDTELVALLNAIRRSTPYADRVIRGLPDQSERNMLLSLFQMAQQDFLTETPEKAREKFETVVSIAHQTDWSIGERKAIMTSYFRLAQISQSDGERYSWLRQAARFDTEITIDKTLFPPPLVSDYEKVRKEELHASTLWDVSSFKKDFIFIKVNGRTYDLSKGSSIRLMNGEQRIHLISNRYQNMVRVMTPEQILTLVSSGVPLALGECSTPAVTDSLRRHRTIVVYARNCVFEIQNGNAKKLELGEEPRVTSAKSTPALQLRELPTHSYPVLSQNSALENMLSKPQVNEPATMNWWSVGLVAAGIAVIYTIVKSQQSNSGGGGKTPTHD